MMIGRIADSYEEGLKVKEIINKLKTVKYSEEIFHIFGFHQVMFIYRDENIKKEHKKKMIDEGWEVVDGQSNAYVYSSFYDDRKIIVPCGIYDKTIKGSLEE